MRRRVTSDAAGVGWWAALGWPRMEAVLVGPATPLSAIGLVALGIALAPWGRSPSSWAP
jgi:hypothetical protein